jgi:hypothetical protein
VKIPAAQFVPPPVPQGLTSPPSVEATLLTWSPASDALWVTGFDSGTQAFSGASSLTSAGKAHALFTHPWIQLPALAYDGVSDRAFLGQISGAGVLAWNGATGATGTPAQSFTLDKSVAAFGAVIDDADRLYAIGTQTIGANTTNVLAVWKGISTLKGATPPDVTLGVASGITGYSEHVMVAQDTLFATMQDGRVLVWKGASSLSGETAPSFTITGGLSHAKKSAIGKITGRLYVLDDAGVAIFDHPTTAPSLVTKIQTGVSSPQDFAVLE